MDHFFFFFLDCFTRVTVLAMPSMCQIRRNTKYIKSLFEINRISIKFRVFKSETGIYGINVGFNVGRRPKIWILELRRIGFFSRHQFERKTVWRIRTVQL